MIPRSFQRLETAANHVPPHVRQACPGVLREAVQLADAVATLVAGLPGGHPLRQKLSGPAERFVDAARHLRADCEAGSVRAAADAQELHHLGAHLHAVLGVVAASGDLPLAAASLHARLGEFLHGA